MKVSLAAQVMSKTVSLALKRHYTTGEADETAELCEMINDFFDCLNVRSLHENERKRNALLAPYRSDTDSRFEWLENVFLKYLADCLSRVVLVILLQMRGVKCSCLSRHTRASDYCQVSDTNNQIPAERRICVCAH